MIATKKLASLGCSALSSIRVIRVIFGVRRPTRVVGNIIALAAGGGTGSLIAISYLVMP
jgi:hypothetical protein